ncbi:hypothetical protein U5N28_11865 [Lysinibacillus telephonicus]|uniref:DUF2269 family protein n=1 Tax=Lysinibacillus telephonicus TaxID=1714840 RepID=A0A431UFB8_9BACI|nr:hypothetical protein [Lysinibacillus telephonicus]RTQ88021.1 hypothetical protein EKG35_18250 [Lysinibacillus telephonicus]
MYSFLVFIHVVSALFLGSFLTLPFIIHTISSRTGNELKTVLRTTLSFMRAGHYALVLLMISGGWMSFGYSSYPSILWVGIAIVLLVLIGGAIGMMHRNLKRIILSKYPENKLVENISKLNWYSWITFLFIMAVVFTMTNRGLFS